MQHFFVRFLVFVINLLNFNILLADFELYDPIFTLTIGFQQIISRILSFRH